jgi:hypothetical protein
VGFQEASAFKQPYDASTQSLLNPLMVLLGDGLNAIQVHPIGIGTDQFIGHTTVKVGSTTPFPRKTDWISYPYLLLLSRYLYGDVPPGLLLYIWLTSLPEKTTTSA